MKQITTVVSLELIGPILTQSSKPGEPGVDSPFARNAGHCFLPYSLVKGRVRQSWEELDAVEARRFRPALLSRRLEHGAQGIVELFRAHHLHPTAGRHSRKT